MLVLVRHGQTEANARGLLLGRLDVPLSEVGRRQAQAVARAVVAGGPIARVTSSPLGRAIDTAAAFGLPVEIDERWIELDYGDYDGRPFGDVPNEVWARWRSDPSFAPPGGESLADAGRRVRAACGELASQVASDTVVVISHVSPIKAAVAWALALGDDVAWRMRLDTASICRIAVGPHGGSLLTFNECGHLAESGERS